MSSPDRERSSEHIATKLETLIVDPHIIAEEKSPIVNAIRNYAQRGTISAERAEDLMKKARVPVPVGVR